MERTPRHEEGYTAEISTTEEGVNVVVGSRRSWRFADREEAEHYFRREQRKFNMLRWGLRGLIVGGALHVAYGVDQAIRTHDPFTGAGAIVAGGLVLVVQGLNQRAIGERERLHRTVVWRFDQEPRG